MTVVERLRPTAVLVENVPDLPVWDDGAVLIGFYESLRDLGYAVDARILDAFAHGVPQHRARLFIVATAGQPWLRVAGARRGIGTRCGCDRRPSGGARRAAGGADGVSTAPVTPLQRRLRRGTAEGDEHVVSRPHHPRRPRGRRRGVRTARRGPDLRDLPEITCGGTEATSSPTSTSASLGRGQPVHHGAHRQGRLLVHPPGAAPDPLGSRGGAGPDLPRLVPVRRPAQPPLSADRQRRAAAAGEAVGVLVDRRAEAPKQTPANRRLARFRATSWRGIARIARSYPWRGSRRRARGAS